MIRTSRAKAAERKNEIISVVRPAHMVCISVTVAYTVVLLQAQGTSPLQSLQLIDEFFLFLMYLTAGLK